MPVEYAKWVPESDIIYLRLRPGKVAKTLERKPEILVDVDENGDVLGVEIVCASATPVVNLFQVFTEFNIQVEASHLTKTGVA